MKLIVGLGNPGKKYKKTRHNTGFIFLDALYDGLSPQNETAKWELSKKFNSEIIGLVSHGENIILAKPMTFMNNSGEAVQLIAHYYKIPPRDIIVAHDDKDLKLGEIKIQKDRSHAGHNGVRSIMESIGTQDFIRIRIGIGDKDERKMADAAKFVLGKFSLLEKKKINKAIDEAIKEVEKII